MEVTENDFSSDDVIEPTFLQLLSEASDLMLKQDYSDAATALRNQVLPLAALLVGLSTSVVKMKELRLSFGSVTFGSTSTLIACLGAAILYLSAMLASKVWNENEDRIYNYKLTIVQNKVEAALDKITDTIALRSRDGSEG